LKETYSIKLGEIIDKMHLDVIHMEESDREKKISHRKSIAPACFWRASMHILILSAFRSLEKPNMNI
jgi:hypothetical protein